MLMIVDATSPLTIGVAVARHRPLPEACLLGLSEHGPKVWPVGAPSSGLTVIGRN